MGSQLGTLVAEEKAECGLVQVLRRGPVHLRRRLGSAYVPR